PAGQLYREGVPLKAGEGNVDRYLKRRVRLPERSTHWLRAIEPRRIHGKDKRAQLATVIDNAERAAVLGIDERVPISLVVPARLDPDAPARVPPSGSRALPEVTVILERKPD